MQPNEAPVSGFVTAVRAVDPNGSSNGCIDKFSCAGDSFVEAA
jgi:hypothetical protein